MQLYHLLIILATLSIFSACNNQNKIPDEAATAFKNPEPDTTVVPVSSVKRKVFSKQTFSNGTLQAAQKVEIPFKTEGTISEITVRNGQHVNSGQLLARINNSRMQLELTQARIDYNRALLELEDLLLGLRYSISDTASIPADIWHMAKLRSGYDDAKLQLARMQYEMELTRITAPISGIITGLEAQTHAPTSAFKNLCVIINNAQMIVSFNLLESDASSAKPGMLVKVMPLAFPDKTFSGRLMEIDPVIDTHGQLKVRALVPNPGGVLFDGMNARVALITQIPDQLVIPKSAVLARQGRQVVFTVEEGLAIWHYVETGYENEDSFAITEGLAEGQIIITGNNLTIGHQAPVKILE